MAKNSTASALRIIGIVESICGVILFFFFMLDGDGSIGMVCLIAALITGIMFLGFGEVILLLQQSADLQTAILSRMMAPGAPASAGSHSSPASPVSASPYAPVQPAPIQYAPPVSQYTPAAPQYTPPASPYAPPAPQPQAAPAQPQVVVPITTPAADMIQCPSCGLVQKADRLVCWECGVKFEKDT